ncbi:MAG: hypothetical protein ACTSVD_08275 [Candidatus Thorarchaeota archaeon]
MVAVAASVAVLTVAVLMTSLTSNNGQLCECTVAETQDASCYELNLSIIKHTMKLISDRAVYYHEE